MLVDAARHAAPVCAAEGHDREAVLKQIREMWEAEFANPTDEVNG